MKQMDYRPWHGGRKARLISNTKGQAIDFAVMFIIFVVVVVVAILCSRLYSDIRNGINPSLTPENQVVMNHLADSFPSTWDKILFSAFILMCIGIIVSVLFINSHPLLFFVGVLFFILFGPIVMYSANMYYDLSQSAALVSFAADFPLMSWVYAHLLTIYLVVGGAAGILLYGKTRTN